MDMAAIFAKIVGLALLFFTARSVYKHFKSKTIKRRNYQEQGQPKSVDADKQGQEQSKIEYALNSLLLYAWFIFMTAFSLGMVVNN